MLKWYVYVFLVAPVGHLGIEGAGAGGLGVGQVGHFGILEEGGL